MPYVRKESRALVDVHIAEIVHHIRNHYQFEARGLPLRVLASAIVLNAKRPGLAWGLVYSNTPPDVRGTFSNLAESLVGVINTEFCEIEKEGVLNYVITRLIVGSYLPTNPCPPTEWPYSHIAAVIDAFEGAKSVCVSLSSHSGYGIDGLHGPFTCAALEFYRRVAAPKEDWAIFENGDIVEYEQPAIGV